MTHYELDARRLLCPMPVIKTQNKVKALQKGDTLSITCTDPGTLQDIPAWCRMYDHQVLEIQQENNEIRITLKVS